MIVLPTSPEPRASILIAADRNAALLDAFLQALARNVGNEVPCETVIVLNGSPEPVAKLVREGIGGAKVVESAVNRRIWRLHGLLLPVLKLVSRRKPI